LLAVLIVVVSAPRAWAAPAWNPPAALTAASASSGDPVVAVDAKGDAVAVWVWSAPTGDSVQVSDHPAGGGWGEPMTLAEAPRVRDPQVAVDANGDTFVAWSQGPDGSHSQVRAADRPSGGIWQTTPEAFGDASLVSGSERLAVDANGDEALAWITTDVSAATSVPYATYRPAGGSWLSPLRLSGSAAQPQTNFPPAVAIDPHGRATVVWQFKDQPSAHSVIQASRHVPGGFFDWSLVASTLSNTAHDSYDPAVAADSFGNVTAIWSDSSATGAQILGADFSAGQGTWSPTPYAVEAATGANIQSPAIAFDQSGDATAAWVFGTGTGDQWVQSADRRVGGGWSQTPTNVSGDIAGADTAGPVLSVAPDGQAAIAWVDDSSGPLKVRASVRDPGGGGWLAPHTPDPTPGAGSDDPSIAIDTNGNAAVLYDGREIDAATYSAPWISDVSIPTTGTVGSMVSFSTSPHDVWSPLATTWTFGDGTQATGLDVAHTYAAPGQYQITLTATNLGGATAGSSRVITITAPITTAGTVTAPTRGRGAPVLSAVSQSHRSWARAGKLAMISARHRIPVGTTFSVTVNEAATLTFSFSQLATGRSIGRRCVTATRKNRGQRSCTLSRRAGTLSLAGHPGVNYVAFYGQLSRIRRLGRGAFTLSITAISGGKASSPATLRFSIVK
jgi:hypothetical protein